MLSSGRAGAESVGRRDLRLQLVCERLTHQPQDDVFVNDAMARGLALEDEARQVYEATTGRLVQPVGFIDRTDYAAGCSLDGLVGDDGVIEIKCPKSATHLRYLRLGVLPSEHAGQVTHNLWVTGLLWCDFVSYDPRFPLPLQLFTVRVRACDVNLAAYEGLVRAFLAEVDAEEAELVARMAAV